MKRKRIFTILLILIVIVTVWQWSLIVYGVKQATGQLSIVWNARPVSEVLNDPATPDSLRRKLELVQNVRSYAVDSLGINPSENYTTYFDQKDDPLMWVVTGSKPFNLEAYEWRFPVVGSFSYKGYFDKEMAFKEADKLRKKGLDVTIRNPGGWSTLGYLKDPILSNMLYRGDGRLAELIIHELTHATIYVKDSVDFNENLATFIGEKGALRFLKDTYGAESTQLREYLLMEEDYEKFTSHMLRGADALNELYAGFNEEMPTKEKRRQKNALIGEIVRKVDTLSLYQKDIYIESLDRYDINNAYFLSFLRYREQQGDLDSLYRRKFNENLDALLSFFKKNYPSL
ncbi:aminopeptidase [Roseivirga sp. BDSF3-8]|uniref:aminopeptidase n=1 Tax=Roseivirga sp. BDSF3-8 TaxID=3241598 RepID=UPI003531BD83